MSNEERTVIKLRYPIENGSETITELKLRRGRLGDLKGIAIGASVRMDDLMLIAGRMCGQPPHVIDKLSDEDAGEVIAYAQNFFVRCLSTGPKSSPD